MHIHKHSNICFSPAFFIAIKIIDRPWAGEVQILSGKAESGSDRHIRVIVFSYTQRDEASGSGMIVRPPIVAVPMASPASVVIGGRCPPQLVDYQTGQLAI
jgi:hypothetical protein